MKINTMIKKLQTVKRDYYYLAAIVILSILLYYKSSKKGKYEQQIEVIVSAMDTIQSFRNELGQMQSSISVFRTTNNKYFTELQAVNESMKRVQELVRSQKGTVTNATVHTVNTIVRDTGKTVIIRETKSNSSPVKFPIIATGKNAYYDASVEVYQDYSKWDISVYNDFEYLSVSKKKGFLGMKGTDHEITVLNKNPYTETKELGSYQMYTKPKRYGIGLQLGYSAYYDQRIKFSPTVGLGLSYNIINF